MDSPNGTGPYDALNAVAAAGPDDVWAAGEGDPWHWNGTEWSIPDIGAQLSRGAGASGSVSGSGSGNVWAAGSYTGGSPLEGVTGPYPRGSGGPGVPGRVRPHPRWASASSTP